MWGWLTCQEGTPSMIYGHELAGTESYRNTQGARCCASGVFCCPGHPAAAPLEPQPRCFWGSCSCWAQSWKGVRL